MYLLHVLIPYSLSQEYKLHEDRLLFSFGHEYTKDPIGTQWIFVK